MNPAGGFLARLREEGLEDFNMEKVHNVQASNDLNLINRRS